MENFKEIAEKCLAGELSGTFILQDGSEVRSNYLRKLPPATSSICSYGLYEWYISDNGNAYGNTGYVYKSSIKRFIPDNMQEQIKIDIPKGKVPVMEQTEKGVVITWKEKELTYDNIAKHVWGQGTQIGVLTSSVINDNTNKFSKKVEVLRKLIMIRNYFGKCDKTKRGYHICKNLNHYDYSYEFIVREFCTCDPHEVVFAKKEHAEQAIKMLGDELKYLFEPW